MKRMTRPSSKQLRLKAKQYEIANFDFMWCQRDLVVRPFNLFT